MSDFQYTAELEAFMNALPVKDKWNSFDTTRQNAITDRAFFDVSAYAAIIAVDFKIENEFCRRALFEQTAHIVSQYVSDSGGKIILQEDITGFGSRKYKDPGNEWLAPRAEMYLKQFLSAVQASPSPSEPSNPSDPSNPSESENKTETPIGPLRILR